MSVSSESDPTSPAYRLFVGVDIAAATLTQAGFAVSVINPDPGRRPSVRVIRGQCHAIRSRLVPARDDGGQSTLGGLCRDQHSVLTIVVEPLLTIRAITARPWL